MENSQISGPVMRGRTALVTGATGHLGRPMAFVLGEAGAHVLVNSRSLDRGEALAKELRAAGHSSEAAIFDVTNSASVDDYFSRFSPDRPLHALVNNAYGGAGGSIKSSTPEQYEQSYDIAVTAAHRLVISTLPNLRSAVRRDGDASIINLATMYALVSPDQKVYDTESEINPPFYGAAKAALIQWTRYAACEFGTEGIRVNSISPGPFPSKRVQAANPAFVKRLSQKVPLGRIGAADEIKGPVLFLASSASSFVNGANLVVDGGWTCW